MQALQEQYDARREGRPPAGDIGLNTLRTELGEADYERYRTAMGQPTSVGVAAVLASSPGERAGLIGPAVAVLDLVLAPPAIDDALRKQPITT